MIITVTLNPALDKTASCCKVLPGALNRLNNIKVDAGGKGINVSKTIAALGGKTLATGFIGGSTGDEIDEILKNMGIETDFVRVSGHTRSNLKVLTESLEITEFNEPGPEISAEEFFALKDKLTSLAGINSLFVFSGSIPQGLAPDTYRVLIEAVRKKGARAFLDADGEAFRHALSAKPDFVKPTIFELMQFYNEATEQPKKELVRLCERLIETGVGRVALSMGADGAIFVSPDEALFSPGIEVQVKSTVGAGDAMTGAFAFAFERGMNFRKSAALAMAASAGAVTTQGTHPSERRTVDALLRRVRLISV